MHLVQAIEENGDRGKYSAEFREVAGVEEREHFDARTGKGLDWVFKVRQTLCDFTFFKNFVDQDFVSGNKLFVAGKRLNPSKDVWEYYVKSRRAEDYRQMLLDHLYHPPHIEIDREKGQNHTLYLVHSFEGWPLVKEFIAGTMMGIEFLWGGPVQLETSEPEGASPSPGQDADAGLSTGAREEGPKAPVKWRRVLYTMENRKLSQTTLE